MLAEIIVIVGMLLFSIGIYLYSGTFPRGIAIASGPAFWPRILAGIIFFSSIGLLFFKLKAYLNLRSRDSQADETNKHQTEAKEPKKTGKVLLAAFLMCLYIFLTRYIGFYIMTILFMLVLSHLLNPINNWKAFFKTFVTAIGVVIFMTYTFGHMLNARLEPGLLRVFMQ